jgi:hypothetical protein
VIDERLGYRLKINGPKDAGVIPIIGAAFCPIDRVIHGIVIDVDLDLIFLTGRLEETRDVVLESVIAALVYRAGGLTVDGDPSIGHHTFELDENRLLSPGRRRSKGALIDTMNPRPSARWSGLTIFVDSEAL